MKTLFLGTLATAFALAGPVSAQVFEPTPVQDGWSVKDLSVQDIDGTIRVTWIVTTGLGNLTILCGAWAVDEPELIPYGAAILARSQASEEGRILLNGLGHFPQASSIDALVGSPSGCQQTTAVSTSNVAVTVFEGDVQLPTSRKRRDRSAPPS